MTDDALRPPCTATTAKGDPCKRAAIAGMSVCNVHAGAKVGRPPKLDDRTTTRLLQVLRIGGYVESAAQVAGISVGTFYDWLKRGDPEGTAPEDEPHRELRRKVDQARAEGEARHVALIAQAAPDDWHAAAWLLERQYPERWARPLQRATAPADQNDANADPLDALDAQVIPLPRRRA